MVLFLLFSSKIIFPHKLKVTQTGISHFTAFQFNLSLSSGEKLKYEETNIKRTGVK